MDRAEGKNGEFCAFIFSRAGGSLLSRLLSSCGKRGLLCSYSAKAPHRGGLSCAAQALGLSGLSSCSLLAQWVQIPGSRTQA